MVRKIKDLPIGALVKDLDTKYYEKPIVWRIVDKDHSGYPINSVTLITDKIISIKPFDAKEPSHRLSYIQMNGNNNYKTSNLLQWLNSDKKNWYTPQHQSDEPPRKKYVLYNDYYSESGFLSNLNKNFIKSILKTTVYFYVDNPNGGSHEKLESSTNKFFLPSEDELGLYTRKNISQDSKISYFSNEQKARAYPTMEAVKQSEYKSSSLQKEKQYGFYTRTKSNDSPSEIRIFKYVTSGYTDCYEGDNGVRPLCNLKNDVLVKDNPDSDGAYIIIYNQPPTRPSNIEIPTKIVATQNLNISWSRASDPDNDSITYILERKLNSNNYTQIYSGGSIKYTDRINKGYSKVKYRVKARDSVGNESDWIYSVERNIINNSTPTISSETAENLGTKTNGFTIDYTVDDEDDNQTLRVYEYLDDLELKSFTATKKKTNTISISEDSFIKILNGNHKIKIKVVDSEGAFAEKTFTFTKNETQIHLELKTPLQADDVITKATLTVNRSIPSGAVFKVEICNNGFDTSPTWQDVTKQVIENKKIFISNKKKTTSKWGLNIRITVNRNGASGDCFINGLGGAFE